MSKAEAILAIGITDIAAREAYLAAFHAAEALIFELTRNVAKTHRGVRAELARLMRSQITLSQGVELLSRGYECLSRGYEWKTDADYGVGEDTQPTSSPASAVIEAAGIFVASVAAELINYRS